MSRTYRELMDATTVNLECFRETIQSTGSIAVTLAQAVGSGVFASTGKTVGFQQRAGSDSLRASANVAPAADCTTSFTFEWAGIPTVCSATGSFYPYIMGVGTGGIQWRGDIAISYLNLYDAAGALARQISNTAAFTFDLHAPHVFFER